MAENAVLNYEYLENENDGIGVLVEMAKAGKIDPWNIDIIDVTDKYLAKICEMKSQNLRLTGRTLLFASILIKLQSNVLEGITAEQFEDRYDEVQYDDDGFVAEYAEDDYIPTNNVISIDEVLQRRTSVRLNRNRTVTLNDLIRQLKFYEKIDQKQALKNAQERAKRRVQSYSRFTPDDIVNMAHEEYIEEAVMTLKANLEQIFLKEDKVDLNSLTLLGMDRISAYIAMLFLAAESDYNLTQDEFYSDVYVIKDNKTGEIENGTVEIAN